ncbi:MAG: mechanosensitive ion channel family protein [Ruminococcus sp.]
MDNLFFSIINKLRQIIDFKQIFNSIDENFIINIIITVVIVGLGIGLIFASKVIIDSIIKKTYKSTNFRKKKTVLKILDNVIKVALLIITVLSVLQIWGFNVTSFIAGLGIASVIVGLALQDAFKDIIMGFNIIVDDYYSVGDIITVGNIHGTVEAIGLKATKIRDFDNDNIHVIGNRNIVSACTESDLIILEVPMPYEEPVEHIEGILAQIMEKAKEQENELKDIEYVGISSYGDSAVYYRLKVWAKPSVKYQVRRNLYRMIKIEMDKNNISIPYMQIDIHNK